MKRSFFRPVHLQAIIFLIIYTFISKTILVGSVVSYDPISSFLTVYLFGLGAGVLLLFLFNHEDFFHFIKDVENIEMKKERKLLHKYLHFGKIIAVFFIATVGGPIFSALTIRLLLNNTWYKYILLSLGNIPSTILIMSIGMGINKSFT